jgi:hypothetical protein
VRTAQRAVEEHLGVGDRYSDDTEPMLMLAEVIAVHVDALDRLAALAETAGSTSAAVGAIRSRVATANDLLGLLGLIGVTPATQNEWMYHQEVQTVIGALMNVAREHGVADEVLGMPVKLIPPEEMIWQKGLIMERERFDGADVAHVLRAQAERLDWPRLLSRYAEHWRVLYAHLILFGFIYPSERARIPTWVMDDLAGRLRDELSVPGQTLCQGTILSREQYLTDVGAWGLRDARLPPCGTMSRRDIAHWTAAIERK